MIDASSDVDHHALSLGLERLEEAFPDPPVMFQTHDDIANLTTEQAIMVLRYARRMLVFQLLQQEAHEHMLDDCGDDLSAATEGWVTVHGAYFLNDGDEAAFLATIKEWLQDADSIGGCDGEIRLYLVSEELRDLMYYPETPN